jgi:hypothetical protein
MGCKQKQYTRGKNSIVLFTRLAELENDCNLTQECRRFPYLVLFPVYVVESWLIVYFKKEKHGELGGSDYNRSLTRQAS